MHTINIDPTDILDKEIDYYKILDSHFEDLYNVEHIHDITSDELGYLSTDIVRKFSRDYLNDEKYTCAINAGVGQGKSTAVLKLSYYYMRRGYKVIIASPFLSIVDDYYQSFILSNPDLVEDVFTLDFFRTKELIDDEGNSLIEKFAQRRLHILTTNLILRNPGDFFQQKAEKKEYLDALIRNCTENRVVVFFDEIHASVDNFNFDRIIKYSKFAKVISKQFILSATFNPASVLVTKYLSAFTEFNIKIVNCERVRIQNRNNDLHLYLHNNIYENKYHNNFFDLLSAVIKNGIENRERIFILSYSAEFCQTIISNNKISSLLSKAKRTPTICTAQTGFKPNDFDNFVIGTNFNTGKSLKNGRYIIILPPKITFNSENFDLGSLGIFTDGGANTFIQSIARMRSGGSIHLIMSTPNYILGREIVENLSKYDEFLNTEDIKIHNPALFNHQDVELKYFYNEMLRDSSYEIDIMKEFSENEGYPYIQYSSYEEFLLKEGRKYIDIRSKDFGRVITPFIIKSAFTNQFENCTLKSLNTYKLFQKVEENSDIKEIFSTFLDEKHKSEFIPEGYKNEVHIHSNFMSDIEAFYYIKSVILANTFTNGAKKIEGQEIQTNKAIIKILFEYKLGVEIDEYTDIMFFHHQMYVCFHFKQYLIDNGEGNYFVDENQEKLVNAFQRIYEISVQFRDLVGADRLIEKSIENSKYYNFFQPLTEEIIQLSIYLNENLPFLKLKVFNFIRVDKNKPVTLNTIFKVFKKINLNLNKTKRIETVEEKRIGKDAIVNFFPFPNSAEECLNLTYDYSPKVPNVDMAVLQKLGFEIIASL